MQNQMQNAKSMEMGNGKTSIAKQKNKKYKKQAGSKVEQNKMRKKAPDHWVEAAFGGERRKIWGR